MEILSDATFKGNVTIDKSLESYDLKLLTGQIKATNQCSPITLITQAGGYYQFGNTPSDSFLRIGSSGIVTSESSFVYILNNGSARIDMPTSNGTLALKSDIPNTSNFALKSEVNDVINDVKNGLLHYDVKLIDFDVPSDCTLFKVGPMTGNDGFEMTGLEALSASMFKYNPGAGGNLNNGNLCYTQFANFAELMPANDGYVYIKKASGYSISTSDKYAVSVIWT